MSVSFVHKSFLVLLVIVQIIFWNGIRFPSDNKDKREVVIWKGTRKIKPDMSIVPNVPTLVAVKALSFGDEQFYFRTRAYVLQNAGDTFGRSTSLKDYDYKKLYQWWVLLDALDADSNFVPPMVSYYYGATPEYKRDIPYVVDYLEQHADRDPAAKWWWYSQAIYHAKYKMEDLDRALAIADKLANIPEDVVAPLWVRQMKAFIYEQRGEFNEACDIIINILEHYEGLKQGELNFMMHFVEERLAKMAQAAEKKGNNVRLDPRCQAIIEQQKQAKTAQKDI